jgi:hypothetical protein
MLVKKNGTLFSARATPQQKCQDHHDHVMMMVMMVASHDPH